MRTIDLNVDVGEIPAALADGSEARLIELSSSVNVACGGHAGDASSMEAVVAIAVRHGVAIGAHPSFPDRQGFGRNPMQLPLDVLELSIASQLLALADVAARAGTSLRHVKPHGALYNVAVKDERIAAAIARGVARICPEARLVGLAGSRMLEVWQDLGFRVAAEAFADRRYEPDATLRSRREPDALLTDPEAAAAQAVEIVVRGRAWAAPGVEVAIAAQTLCVHGDTPNAVAILAAVRAALAAQGIRVTAVA